MVTPFGKAVRKLRLDKGVILKDMAEALDVHSAYLSAVETGKKRITDNLLEQVADYFSEYEGVEEVLRGLVEQSQPELRVKLADRSNEDRELLVAFARKFSDLSDNKKSIVKELIDDD